MADRKEYIERGALLQDIEETALFTVRGGEKTPTSEMRGARKVIGRIEAAPTADVVEVVHAQWDENGRCKNCGKQANVQSIGFGHCVGTHRINYEHTKFCSECGAKMDATDNNVGGKPDDTDTRPGWQQSMLRTFGGDADV